MIVSGEQPLFVKTTSVSEFELQVLTEPKSIEEIDEAKSIGEATAVAIIVMVVS